MNIKRPILETYDPFSQRHYVAYAPLISSLLQRTFMEHSEALLS